MYAYIFVCIIFYSYVNSTIYIYIYITYDITSMHNSTRHRTTWLIFQRMNLKMYSYKEKGLEGCQKGAEMKKNWTNEYISQCEVFGKHCDHTEKPICMAPPWGSRCREPQIEQMSESNMDATETFLFWILLIFCMSFSNTFPMIPA